MSSHCYRIETATFKIEGPAIGKTGRTTIQPRALAAVMAAVIDLYCAGDGGELTIKGTDYGLTIEASYTGGERSSPDWNLWDQAAPYLEDTDPIEIADLDDGDPVPWFFRIRDGEYQETEAVVTPAEQWRSTPA